MGSVAVDFVLEEAVARIRPSPAGVGRAPGSSPGAAHGVGATTRGAGRPQASGEALRHVLTGGVHSVEDFAAEVADAESDDPLPAHQMTKIIGEVIAELDE